MLVWVLFGAEDGVAIGGSWYREVMVECAPCCRHFCGCIVLEIRVS